MPEYLQASVLSIIEIKIGTELALDHIAGDPILSVYDTSDFSDNGGQVEIEGVLYDYVSKDDDLDTLTLASSLPIDMPMDAEVYLYPAAYEKEAMCQIDQEDSVMARVPHQLVGSLEAIVKDLYKQESVQVYMDGSEWVIHDVIAQPYRFDGANIMPGTVPDPYEQPEPPATSPEVAVTGMVTGLVIRTVGQVVQGTRLQYHISTESGFTPSPDTLYTISPALVLVMTSLADGTPLEVGKSYYIKVIAENSKGPSTDESDEVEGSLDTSVVSTLVTAELIAGFIMTGEIQVGQIRISATEGIVIPQVGGRETVLKADGTSSTFVGSATFDSLTTLDRVTINGLTNFINGLVTLKAGVGDPLQRPTVSANYAGFALGDGSAGFSRRGLCQHTNGAYVTIDYYGNSGNIQFWSDTGVPVGNVTLPSGWLPIGGITRVDSRLYVLCAQATNGGWDWSRTNYRVYIYEESGTYVGYHVTNINTTGTTSRPMIGSTFGGAAYIIAYVNGTSLFSREFDSSSGALNVTRTLSTTWGTSDVCGVARQPVPPVGGDSNGTARIVVASPTSIFVWNTSGTRVPTEDWLPARTPVTGIWFGSDSRWKSAIGGAIYHYTQLSGARDFGYTWVDTDPAGLGTAETRLSPRLSLTSRRMARWNVSLPDSPPDDGTNDGANAASIYVGPVGSALILQGTLTSTWMLTLTSLSTVGATPPGTSGFAGRTSTAIGRLASGAVDSAGPLIDLRGDGPGRAGYIRWDAAGKPVDSILIANGTTNYETVAGTGFVYPAGLSEQVFVAPLSGRVDIVLTAFVRAGVANNAIMVGPEVRTGATIRSGTVVLSASTVDSIANYSVNFIRGEVTVALDGLTAGASYNVYCGVYRNAAAGHVQQTKMRVIPR